MSHSGSIIRCFRAVDVEDVEDFRQCPQIPEVRWQMTICCLLPLCLRPWYLKTPREGVQGRSAPDGKRQGTEGKKREGRGEGGGCVDRRREGEGQENGQDGTEVKAGGRTTERANRPEEGSYSGGSSKRRER